MHNRSLLVLLLALAFGWVAFAGCPSQPPTEQTQEGQPDTASQERTPAELTAETPAETTELAAEPTAEPAPEPTQEPTKDAAPVETPPQETPAEPAPDVDTGGLPRLRAPTISTPVSGPDIVQIQPSLAVGSDGTLAMSYTAAEGDKKLGIFLALLDQDGKIKGTHVRLDTFKGGNKTESETCALSSGGYVTAWSMDTGNPDPKVGNLEVRFRITDAAGKPVGTDSTQVKTDQPGNHWLARLTCLAGGGFVMTGVYPDDGQSFGVFAQRFDDQGSPVGDALKLNDTKGGNQAYPVVASAADGSFAVAWEQGTNGAQPVFRTISADGKTIGGEVLPPSGGSTNARPNLTLVPGTGEIILSVRKPSGVFQLIKYAKDGTTPQTLPSPDTTSTNFAAPLLRSLDSSGAVAVAYIRGPNNNSGSPTVAIVGSHPQPAFAITTGRIPLPYRPGLAYDPATKTLWVAYTERTDVQGGLTIKLARFK